MTGAGIFPVAVLAGGLGTRLRPLTADVPKALVEINGEPFIAHQLRLLRDRGVEYVVLCAAYRAEMIRARVGDGCDFGLRVEYSLDGPSLRGTAGAIRQALPLLGERFFVLYGDSYLPCDYAGVQREFLGSGKLGLMTVFRNEGRWDTSNVEFAAGRIRAYDKRNPTPRMRHIDHGLGVFHRRAFAAVPEEGAYDLAQLYQDLLGRDELAAYEVRERFYEAGSIGGIRELEQYLRGKDRLEERG
jgi:NDP-sugar pyrophosphorylase family protein